MDLTSRSMLLLISLVFRDVFTSDSGSINISYLPHIATVPENSPPGTQVIKFSFNLNMSHSPAISISSEPQSNFFRTIYEKQSASTYSGKIVLTNQASLDYEINNYYELTLGFTAVNASPKTGTIFVDILDVDDYLHCNVKIQGGVTIRIPETLSPGSTIYTVVPLHSTRGDNFTYSTSDLSLRHNFRVDEMGNVFLQNGFSHHSEKRNIKLRVSVRNNLGEICSGILNIMVMPVYNQAPTFQNIPNAVSIPEKQGPGYVVARIEVTGSRPHYLLKNPNPFFQIDKTKGDITTTSNLDLDKSPGLADYPLVIVAYNESFLYSSSATISVYVKDVNDNAPECTPAIFVTTIPETTAVGTILFPLTCIDPDFSRTTLSYTVVSDAVSQFKFKYQDYSVQVNTSLDYDVVEMVKVSFRYTAAVIVTDSGNPPRSTTVSILVTVSPVNEHSPVFQGTQTFTVQENRQQNTFVGLVSATDADWMFNNLRFSIISGNTPLTFYIDPFTGKISTLIPLDFESLITYKLTIQAVDINNDVLPDPKQQKTAWAEYTINMQNVNDIPPVCNPSIYEQTIYSTLTGSVPIVTISCTDKDSASLHYSIVGGNTNDRFVSIRNQVYSRNTFSYHSEGVNDQTTFELLIQVTDSEDGKQSIHLTTTATVIIHVVPWTTTFPTTTTQLTTQRRDVKVVTVLNTYWKPPIWFVTVLTAVAVLAIITLALLLWKVISRAPCYNRLVPPQEMSQPLVQDRSLTDTESLENESKNVSSKGKEDIPPQSTPSLQQFDGRAVDPGTGRDYLFNTDTGARRWV